MNSHTSTITSTTQNPTSTGNINTTSEFEKIPIMHPSQLLNILHLNTLLEQPLLIKTNQIAANLRRSIQRLYPAHLDNVYKVSMFSLDKNKDIQEHNNIIKLFRITHARCKTLEDAIAFLNLCNQIKNELPDDNLLKNIIADLNIDDCIDEITQNYHGNQNKIISFLLTILMHKKAIHHDVYSKALFHSSIDSAQQYHSSQIYRQQQLLHEPCIELYRESPVPMIISSSILVYLTQELLRHLKQSANADSTNSIIENITLKLKNDLINWVSETEDINVETFKTEKNDDIITAMITEIIQEVNSFLGDINIANIDKELDKEVTNHIISKFQEKILDKDQIASQILQHRAHKIIVEAGQCMMNIEFNLGDEDAYLKKQFESLSKEQYISLLLNQYSLYMISYQINFDINYQNHTNNHYNYSDPSTYYTALKNLTPIQQEEVYFTLLFGLQFIEHLKYLEKTHFADCLHKEATDTQSKLYPTQHRNRLHWYQDCLTQAFYQPKNESIRAVSALDSFLLFQEQQATRAQEREDREIEQLLKKAGIKTKNKKNKESKFIEQPYIDCMDVFSRQSFLSDLHFEVMNILINPSDKLCESLESTLQSYINTKLDKSHFEEYQTYIVLEWQRLLKKEFDLFKIQLKSGLEALRTGNTQNCDPLTLCAISVTKDEMPYLESKNEFIPMSSHTLSMG